MGQPGSDASTDQGRVLADAALTDWAGEAEADDRRYRRMALWIGVAGAVLLLLAWAALFTLGPPGWVAWGGLGVVIAAWVVTALWVSRW